MMYWHTESIFFKYSIGIIAQNKNIYYPVDTETMMERHQWNHWFIIGWHVYLFSTYIINYFVIIIIGGIGYAFYVILYQCFFRISCIVIYVVSAFYIILYGLKFGRIKSLCWLTSITIGILQGAIITSPLKIIIISAILGSFGREVKVSLLILVKQ